MKLYPGMCSIARTRCIFPKIMYGALVSSLFGARGSLADLWISVSPVPGQFFCNYLPISRMWTRWSILVNECYSIWMEFIIHFTYSVKMTDGDLYQQHFRPRACKFMLDMIKYNAIFTLQCQRRRESVKTVSGIHRFCCFCQKELGVV